MTRIQARRRKKRRRMIRKIGAWMVLFLFELFVAAVPTAMLAAILLLALRERGYIAMGSEWMAIPVAFCITYSIFHLWICKKIFEEV